mmetsp:Transcript_20648/g.50707  ORF Transcript_20648/g.50707 Transcript_20648/m.50707 type:complete len:404 (+) Transcript_20648:81-1292(+)
MPRKAPAKRRRKVEEDENPKVGKNQKVQTTPPTQEATEEAMTNPPPMQLHSNPKVSSSAVKGIAPPPIDNGDDNDNDDMVPPPAMMNHGSTKASSSPAKSSPAKENGNEAPQEMMEPEEDEETPSHGAGGGASFNILLVCLLIGLGCSAGFVHQRIAQDLQLQLKGYQQELLHTNEEMALLKEKGNNVAMITEQVDQVRSELIDLVHEIRYFARQQLKAKFGPGPIYQVELELEFPPGDEGEQLNLQYMTVDLDGENMPHAVLTFMQQADAGLYHKRGFGFHHVGDHIVFGSPSFGIDELTGNEFGQVWEDSGHARLLFHEHSEVVPHVPYTIGFSGRGPDLYFNMMDNTEAHHEARDPCFGTISRGRNVADYMHSMAGTLEPGDWKEMEHPVIIRSANIILP